MADLAQQFMRELTAPRAWFLLLIHLLLWAVRYTFRAKRARKRPVPDAHVPPSPPALPVLGHLHLLGSLPHVSLRTLATKHGADLMLLRLGAMPVLVVSSPRAAEAVLRTHDHVFASRPPSMFADVLMYGRSDIGFAPYGDYWRKAKKLITTHLLTAKRVQSFCHARKEEVSVVMAQIGEAAAAGTAVNVSDLLGCFTNDLVCRAVMGKSFRREGRNKLFRELAADTSPILAGFNIEEFFPFLAHFGVASKVVRAKSQRLRKRWDKLLDRLIDDPESKNKVMAAAVAASQDEDDNSDFIHILLSVRQEYGLTRDQMKAILLDAFFGGIDTSSAVLEYTIIELLQRPRVMTKLRAEVRSRAKGQGIVSEGDLNSMPYLRAVIKESLRLHPVTPLLAPHFSMDSCSIDGLEVPAGGARPDQRVGHRQGRPLLGGRGGVRPREVSRRRQRGAGEVERERFPLPAVQRWAQAVPRDELCDSRRRGDAGEPRAPLRLGDAGGEGRPRHRHVRGVRTGGAPEAEAPFSSETVCVARATHSRSVQ